MGKTLYLECYNGISGDMAVAALLDLGADRDVLDCVLQNLPLNGFSIQISHIKKAGLDTCDFNVILQQENHDHDMEYLHGPNHQVHIDESAMHQNYDHTHHEHTHDHIHQDHIHTYQEKHPVHHEHRGLADILFLIQQSNMTDRAKQIASNIFTILGNAEAKAHGTSIENVHFHEVGAIDSIVDIISFAVCFDNLNITDVILPVLYEGCGTIRCQHGILPIPVPATVNIIQEHQIPLHITETPGEFVTPTGAAIAAAIRTASSLPDHFHILRIGLGAGKRTYERPSILRAMLIEYTDQKKITDTDIIYKLETNIDDCTGETLGYVLECLMDAGAKDVHYFPVYMKKNRPAYQLNVICNETDIPKMEQIIFRQTTTIGIRRQHMERSILPREIEKIQTDFGEVLVKVCTFEDNIRIYPEYVSIARICKQTGKSYFEIYTSVQEICRQQLIRMKRIPI